MIENQSARQQEKIKNYKSLGDWAEVYQIWFNSLFYVQKIEHTSVRFDLTAIVFKKKEKDIGVLAAFKLNMSQQYYSFPPKLKQSEVAFTKKNA